MNSPTRTDHSVPVCGRSIYCWAVCWRSVRRWSVNWRSIDRTGSGDDRWANNHSRTEHDRGGRVDLGRVCVARRDNHSWRQRTWNDDRWSNINRSRVGTVIATVIAAPGVGRRRFRETEAEAGGHNEQFPVRHQNILRKNKSLNDLVTTGLGEEGEVPPCVQDFNEGCDQMAGKIHGLSQKTATVCKSVFFDQRRRGHRHVTSVIVSLFVSGSPFSGSVLLPTRKSRCKPRQTGNQRLAHPHNSAARG